MNLMQRFRVAWQFIKSAGPRLNINRLMSEGVVFMDASQRVFIQNAYKINPNVYSAINLITRQSAKMRFKLIKRLTDGTIEHLPGDDQILQVLKRPNPLQGRAEYLENLVGYKFITGEVFEHMVAVPEGSGSPNDGQVQELWIQPPPIVNIKHDAQGLPQEYILQIGNQRDTRPADEFIHNMFWNPDPETNGRGLSPLVAGSRPTTQSNKAYTASVSLLQSQGALGIMTIAKDGVPVTETQAGKVQEKWKDRHAGETNYGDIVFTGAQMDWKSIGMNAVDLAILESQKSSLRDICNVLGGVPSQLLNDPDNKTFANMKEARKFLIENIVVPVMQTFIDEWNRAWVEPEGVRRGEDLELIMDLSGYPELQEDLKVQADALDRLWFMTPNQKLIHIGFPESSAPLMDIPWAPTNLIPITEDTTQVR